MGLGQVQLRLPSGWVRTFHISWEEGLLRKVVLKTLLSGEGLLKSLPGRPSDVGAVSKCEVRFVKVSLGTVLVS